MLFYQLSAIVAALSFLWWWFVTPIVVSCFEPIRKPEKTIESCSTVATVYYYVADKESAAQALVVRSIAYEMAGEVRKGESDFKRALSLTKRPSNILYLRAVFDGDAGNLERALQGFEALELQQPENANYLRQKAIILRRMGRKDEAYAALERSLAKSPNDAGALNDKSWFLFRMGRNEEALVLVDRSLALDPRSDAALDTRANVLSVLGRAPEAVEYFELAVAKSTPDRREVYIDLLKKLGYLPPDLERVDKKALHEAFERCAAARCELVEDMQK